MGWDGAVFSCGETGDKVEESESTEAKAESEAAKAGQLYEVVAKAQLKKQTKMFAQEVMIIYKFKIGQNHL